MLIFLENPNKPELVIDAGVPVVCLEYNPRDNNSLVGGLYSGQVSFFKFCLKCIKCVSISIIEFR